jgi:hypothetical protein
MQALSLQHVSNILWAYASLQRLRPPMAAAFVDEILRRLAAEPFNPQQLSNLLWSLCIAEVRALPIFSCGGVCWGGTLDEVRHQVAPQL